MSSAANSRRVPAKVSTKHVTSMQEAMELPRTAVLNVVGVKDVRLNTFHQPTCVQHTAGMVRAFGDMLRDPNSDVAKHPEDYELYLLGTFDPDTGRFESCSPERLARAVDFINS